MLPPSLANRMRGDRFHLLAERRTLTAECLQFRKRFLAIADLKLIEYKFSNL
ncbi:MAG: hypothetical protein QNJ37_20320 [Crocosphaera sp.]|nr:hypothetical protein [Crocosphaera sp.]